MKELVAIRLVNWYHFEHVTLRLGGSCQLLGTTRAASRPSWMRSSLSLVGDMAQVQFNKQPTRPLRRSLGNYVRYKLGSESESDGRSL